MGHNVRKRGDIYWIFGHINGVRLDGSLRTKIKKVAEEIAKKRVEKALEETEGVRLTGKIRLPALFDKYLEYCRSNNRASTCEIKSHIVKPLLAYFGDVPLKAITFERMEDYKAARLALVKPSTINRELSLIKHALHLAVEWGYVSVSPAAKVKKLREPAGRATFLTETEAEKLLAACSDDIRPVVVTALHTGMRRGEILALDWSNVDLDRRQIRIIDSKNHESRVVPINEILYNMLEELPDRQGKVFLRRSGSPYLSIRSGFEAALKRAGIIDFRFHDLRHTFASWLVMAGKPLYSVGQLLGHKSYEMTQRYAHLAPGHLADVVEVLTQNSHSAENR